MNEQNIIQIFEDKKVRIHWDAGQEKMVFFYCRYYWGVNRKFKPQ